MSPEELARTRKALTPRLNKFVIEKPHPKQTVFLLLNDVLEVLYGGAAGGGKSSALLMAAAQYVDVPGYAALILRRSFRDLNLPGALMDRSHKWWDNTAAKWSSADYKWTFPSGAIIQFGYMEREGDETRYQSFEAQFIGFDELTQFPEHQYTYMFSRLRRLAGSEVPIRMRGGTNPGGRGHEWVKKRWSLPTGQSNPDRAFVQALLPDNPSLDAEMYEKSFNELSTLTRQQLREGDWDAQNSGGKFRIEWFQKIRVEDVPDFAYWERIVRHWDLATQEKTDDVPDPDYTAGVKVVRVSKLPKSVEMSWKLREQTPPAGPYWIILDVKRERKNAGDVEELVSNTSAIDGLQVTVSIEQERGASGKGLVSAYRRHVLPGRKVRGLWAKGTKEERAAISAGRAKEGRVFIVEGPWNDSFLDEHSIFGIKDVHDDQVDAFSGAIIAMERLDFTEDQGEAVEH